MKNRFIIFCFFMLAAVPAAAGSITVDKQIIDFGQAPDKTRLAFEVTLTNTSRQDLHVSLRASCDCFSADPERVDIAPENKAKIKLLLDTDGYSGLISKKVFVHSDDPETPFFPIEIKGTVVKNLAVVIPVTIFDSAGCLFCMKLKNDIIPSYMAGHGVWIELQEYDINEPRDYEKLMYLEKKLGSSLNRIPVAFIGSDVVGGKEEILERLPSLIEKYKKAGGAPRITVGTEGDSSKKALRKMRLLPVIAAGLVDSLNPCAFAAIIFFISYMSWVLKKSRFQVLLAGMLFILGVFLTYFAVGAGLLRAVEGLKATFLASKVMYGALALILLFLAYRHFHEAVLIRRNGLIGNEEVKLKLPGFAKEGIHRIIRFFTPGARLLPLIFVAGVLVTLLELFCTGQIYLPTIVYLASLHEHRTLALAYLFLYSFLFVLPLIVIFWLFYSGWTTERIKRCFQGRVYLLKGIMAVFFFMMALFILATVFLPPVF